MKSGGYAVLAGFFAELNTNGANVLIGAVADDITGASDLCLMLARAGLHTVQVMGVPDAGAVLPKADAVVIALKTRTIPADQAVEMSIQAATALVSAGAEQILYKYCSTFDSTDAGNIGPVTEALLTLTVSDVTIACPAFPANGRTVYLGHLFVGSQLLSDSPMKDHPLTPMRDSNLMRILALQTTLPIGLVEANTIAKGPASVRSTIAAQQEAGVRIVVVDTLRDADLMVLGAACADMRLLTGGSGIAMGLAANFVSAGRVAPRSASPRMPVAAGRAAVLAGSCSAATLAQIKVAQDAGFPTLALDVAELIDCRQTAQSIADWVIRQTGNAPPVVFSSIDPVGLAQAQAKHGREKAGALVEQTLADVATKLLAVGFARFVIAGGETAGAVVSALGVQVLEIGPEIDPGVPWTRCIRGPDIALALKSGNFGAPDFFIKAWSQLDAQGK